MLAFLGWRLVRSGKRNACFYEEWLLCTCDRLLCGVSVSLWEFLKPYETLVLGPFNLFHLSVRRPFRLCGVHDVATGGGLAKVRNS